MATFVTRDGCNLRYEIAGTGTLIALTPGGREGKDALAALASALSQRARVLTWDRRNTGASDLYFGGDGTEQQVWADDLADLIAHLGLGPAWLAGGSAGFRVSLIAAIRHPQAALGLVIWSASGGAYGSQFLGFQYHVPYIMAAERGGMAEVAATPFFAARIAANRANRDRLLALDPAEFIATLKRWNQVFYHREDTPVVGATADELRRLCLPTLIFEGNDDIHPPQVAAAVAGLIPGARLRPSPWPREAWMDLFTGRRPGTVFDLYPQLAPEILEFIGA